MKVYASFGFGYVPAGLLLTQAQTSDLIWLINNIGKFPETAKANGTTQTELAKQAACILLARAKGWATEREG